MAGSLPGQLEDFAAFVKANEPLAAFTHLKVGGPAEALAQPRTVQELAALVCRCLQKKIPLHILGAGSNLLVRDEGVRGVVLHLSEPVFTSITVNERSIRAGSGAALSALITQAARQGLAGLESFVGLPGTVGGALRPEPIDQTVDLGQLVTAVEVLDANGQVQRRERAESRYPYGWSNQEDPVLLTAEFSLDTDSAAAIVKRMKKAWIMRKAQQPYSFQASGRLFKNPRGLSAATLIEQAGLAGTKVGSAEISERHANYAIAHPGASARDVLRLIDLVKSRVQERFHTELELEMTIW